MDWQEQILRLRSAQVVTIYLYVCKDYGEKLWKSSQRMSNYSDLSFCDEEVMTIYLFGIIDGRTSNREIYKYTARHLGDWFPKLPSYTAFVQRLNKVFDVFAPLLVLSLSKY